MPFERRPAEEPRLTPDDEVAPPEVPECGADSVSFEVVTNDEVMGSDMSGFPTDGNRNLALMARSGVTCGLSAWPVVRLATADGRHEDLVAEPGASPPRTERLLLTGFQRVVGIVRWASWCGPAGSAVRIEAHLANGDTVSAPLADPPPCDPTPQNMAGFWMTFPAQPPDGPLEADVVELPPRAPFDGTLEAVVELLNPGTAVVPLDPCPVYRLSYGESGTGVFAANEFNCQAAPGEIPPGGRLRFAVELELPAADIPDGFHGTFSVALYLDDQHQPASASVALETD